MTAALPRRRAADWPLVGRDAQLGRIADALSRPDCSGVVLSGAAGVGKTRLAGEALALGEQAGRTTVRTAATSATSLVPLGALLPILPSSSDTLAGPDLLTRARRVLTSIGGDRPLMLVLDDAHLLDDASATVANQAVTHDGVFVLATVRSGPVPEPITALWKDGIAERIEIADLSAADTAQLVETALDGPVDGATQRTLFDRSHGNPLFVRELVLAALETGLLGDHSGLWRLDRPIGPVERLTELIDARLADLGDREREALEIVAFAEPADPQLLSRLTEATDLESLEAAGLIKVTVDGGRREVRLAHPLYGDVLRTGLPALRAMRLNHLLADALEDSGPDPDDYLRLAVWRLEGGGAARPELMIGAARRAHFAFDDALAERLLRTVVDDGAGSAAGVLLGEVLGELGRHDEAEAVLARAGEQAETVDERALAVIQRAEELFWGLDRDQEAMALLTATATELDGTEWAAEMLGQRATFDLLDGRPEAALDAVDEHLGGTVQGRPFVEAAIVAGAALAICARCEQAIEVADHGFAAHIELGDRLAAAHPGIHIVNRALALIEAGRLLEAEGTGQVGYEQSLALRSRIGQAWFALMLGRGALCAGRIETAKRWFSEGAAVYLDLGYTGPRRWCIAGIALCGAMAGDASRSAAAIAELDSLGPHHMMMMEADVLRARAWDALVHGEPVTGRALLVDAATLARDAGALALEASALHDQARTGDPSSAAGRLAEVATLSEGVLIAARADHAAALERENAEALDHCATAFEQMGANLYAAESAAAASAAHRRAGHARQADRSALHSRSLVARCEDARTPALALAGATAVLTPREREVATMAAAGQSSKAIAERLFVSPRTVESQLHRAYEKLGVSSRAELAAALAEANQ